MQKGSMEYDNTDTGHTLTQYDVHTEKNYEASPLFCIHAELSGMFVALRALSMAHRMWMHHLFLRHNNMSTSCMSYASSIKPIIS